MYLQSSFLPLSLSLSLPLFLVALTLEHKASVKRFVSLQFLNPKAVVGLQGLGISPSQGHYLRMQNNTANKYVLSGIRTHDPSVRESDDGSCLRPSGHCDRCSSYQV
jgi:hypothetical protein